MEKLMRKIYWAPEWKFRQMRMGFMFLVVAISAILIGIGDAAIFIPLGMYLLFTRKRIVD